jgi:hypothetical protein
MPELPGEGSLSIVRKITKVHIEVERAARLLRKFAKNNLITQVDTTEDVIVYSGTTHHQFVGHQLMCRRRKLTSRQKQALEGRVVKDVARYGAI